MSKVLISGSQVADWQKLVSEAEAELGVSLDDEMESYLVFTLMHYSRRPDMASRVMALDYLQAMQSSGSASEQQMREVADQCLLLTGLFPARARRRRVSLTYYVDLGRSAYQHLAENLASMTEFYSRMAQQFIQAMDTLHTIRQMSEGRLQLDPLETFNLWQQTGSRAARAQMALITQAIPIAGHASLNKKH
ncbi:hypothetical protein MNBD_GAMMA24-1093 [hydrothermal vent metagenome]|uniref:Uncharacterized protein n=1 Tax=hydrothermal vent metagenome TaxID=652676 RepID=A0A3B1BB00_9ZZZZ